jgi:hypothetical protein
VRLTAMAKSAPLAKAVHATSFEKKPESPRTIGRGNPSGNAATARAMSPGACGRGSLLPEPSSAARAQPVSAQAAGCER